MTAVSRGWPTRRGVVVTAALLGAGLLLLAAGQTWVQGRPTEGFTAGVTVRVVGGAAAPLVPAAALVAAAAAVAAGTAGRVVRWLAAAVLPVAALVAILGLVRLLTDPAGPVGTAAAAAAGRSGSLPASATLTPWVWVGAVAAAVLLAAGLAALTGVRGWSGLSSRYDAPSPGAPGASAAAERAPVGDSMRARSIVGRAACEPAAAGAAAAAADAGVGVGDVARMRAGREARTTWDRLSAGEDPTWTASSADADTTEAAVGRAGADPH